MFIVVIENPSNSLVNSEDIVVQIIAIAAILLIKLFSDFLLESLVTHQIIHRVGNLLDIEIDVTF